MGIARKESILLISFLLHFLKLFFLLILVVLRTKPYFWEKQETSSIKWWSVNQAVLLLHCNVEVTFSFSVRMNLQWIKLFKLSIWRVKMHIMISQHQLCCWVTFHENTLLCKTVNKIELTTHLAAEECCSGSASQAGCIISKGLTDSNTHP